MFSAGRVQVDFFYFRRIILNYCGFLREPCVPAPFRPASPRIFAVVVCSGLALAKTAPFTKAPLRAIMSVRVPFAMPIVPEIGLAAVLRPALIAARIQISTKERKLL